MKGYNPLNGTSPQQTLFIKRVLNKVKAAISGMQEKLTAGSGIKISTENVISADVTDVKISDNSIVTSGVANIPISSATNIGVVGIKSELGLGISSAGNAFIVKATETEIDNRNTSAGVNTYRALVISNVDYAVVKALTDNSIVLNNNQKEAILTWLGFPAFPAESGRYDLVLDTTGSNPVLSWVAQGG